MAPVREKLMEWIDGNTFFGSWPKRLLDVPTEALVRLLRNAGISRALTLSFVAPLLDAVEGNQRTREATVKHRELIPFAAVDPRRFTGGDAGKQLHDLGCAAVRITNDINNFPLNASPVEEILKSCAAADLTVFVDVSEWGRATTVERLAGESGCRIVMCGVRYSFLSEAIVCMKRSKSLYLETSKLNTPDGVGIVCGEVGAERVLFGSGAPLNYVASARMVAQHNHLNDAQLDWVSSKTVLSLLCKEYRS